LVGVDARAKPYQLMTENESRAKSFQASDHVQFRHDDCSIVIIAHVN